MKSKKAQFYLIAAIIIIGVIVLLASVTNYIVTKDKPVKFYDLGDEFKEEGTRVVDYGIYNGGSGDYISDLMDKFATYSEEKSKGSELVFVHGNKAGLTITTYSTVKTGGVSLVVEGNDYAVSGTNKYISSENNAAWPTSSDYIDVQFGPNIGNQKFTFELHPGENFFFVINKKEDKETYITQKT